MHSIFGWVMTDYQSPSNGHLGYFLFFLFTKNVTAYILAERMLSDFFFFFLHLQLNEIDYKTRIWNTGLGLKRDDSAVKSACCPSRGPELSFQYPPTAGESNALPSPGLQPPAHMWHIFTQTQIQTHINKDQISFLKEER